MVGCLLAGCASAGTEVIVVTDTNLRGPTGLDEISIDVVGPDGTATQRSVAHLGAAQPELPRTLGLVWETGPLGPFTVHVRGLTAARVRLERTARFSFVTGRTLVLRLDLLAGCEGVTCGADMTCAESGCRPVEIAPAELVPFTGVLPGLDGATPGDGGDSSDAGDAGDAGIPDVGMFDVGMIDSGPVDGGTDTGPIGCTLDGDCAPLDGSCVRGTCTLATGICGTTPRPDGTSCDDGLFCTATDTCTAGSCGGAARDCSSMTRACNTGACDEGADACVAVPVADGSSCDDGLFCTTGDVCASGACGGAARVCMDGLFCNGAETCDEVANVCTSSGAPCDDGFSCTLDGCMEAGGACTAARSEAACGAAQICNPVAYATAASGCGAAPTTLSVACPAMGTAGASSACMVRLAAGATGVPGEAANIVCTATPAPVQLFADDFAGGLDAAWMTTAGTPRTDSTLASEAAVATANWQADVSVRVAGLATTCVDFRVAQANANGGERIRWDVSFDAGAFATVFDLDFNTWEVGTQTYAFNRNVCVSVPGGATSARWRLRMDSNMPAVWVDDVAISGIGAAFTVPANGGPDDFGTPVGWTFAGGSPPYVGANGGSSALFAEQETYTATRGAIDATACDVLDVDFDIGYAPGAGALDSNDDLRMEVSIGGGAFSLVELVDFNNGVWNVNNALLPWLGIRRITDAFPAAVGAASVVLRFRMSADNPGERTWVDNFVAHCADLPTPTLTAVTDAGGGMYSVGVRSAVPVTATVSCTWSTSNDGPLTASDVVPLLP